MSKVVRVDDREGACRIFNGDRFSGTAVVHGASPDDHTCFQCDFELDTLQETWPEQVRSRRLLLQKAGKPAPKIRPDQLAKEIVVIFGPEMSANDAVASLERLARQIRKNGLLIGRGIDEDGDFMAETTGMSPKII